jgi:hypothetical protein
LELPRTTRSWGSWSPAMNWSRDGPSSSCLVKPELDVDGVARRRMWIGERRDRAALRAELAGTGMAKQT